MFRQCCPGLQQLYASNNRFSDASPLASCPSLSFVGLHGNLLGNLMQTVQVLLDCRRQLKLYKGAQSWAYDSNDQAD